MWPLFLALLLIPEVLAHEEVATTSTDPLQVVLFASILLFVLVYYVLTVKIPARHKPLMFGAIVIPILLVTGYLFVTTIQMNLNSATNGPVHWHADFELYKCGQQINLIDPTGSLNRVGSSLFHEHGDNRIHVEGVVTNLADVSLHRFFEVVGGNLTDERIMVPTNTGVVSATNGELCDRTPGVLQAFVYSTTGTSYTQRKLEDIESYVLAPYSTVPPGDCIIIEFGPEKNSTTHLCTTYRIAEQKGELHGR